MFMARFLHLDSVRTSRKFGALILALSWCFGLGFGLWISKFSGASLYSLMDMAVSCRVSFVGTLIPFLLPFLFSAIAVYLSFPRLLIVICFVKAALFAYIACALLGCYGSAGWLIQMLVMFSDICFSALLFWFWIRHMPDRRGFSRRETVLFLLAGLIIAGVDYFAISPFFRGVLLI